jgi:hypothetical protein
MRKNGTGKTGKIVGNGVFSPRERGGDWNYLLLNDDVIDTIKWFCRAHSRTASRGDRHMTSTRSPWVRFLLAGLGIAMAPLGLPTARAQGFSPDPFKPFNSQFEQFVYPISPFAGGPGAAAGAMGRVDNQYQQYLKELEGADRALNQRYGIGVPHWKLRSDIDLDRRDQASRGVGRRGRDAGGSITQRYLAYFSESDPKKRANLLREITTRSRQEDRDVLVRAVGETENGEAGLESGRAGRGGSGSSRLGGRSGSASPLRDSAKTGDATGGRSTAPPPPRGRFGTGAGRIQRKPTDVLDRSRRLDDDVPSTRRPAAAGRRNSDGPAPSSPDE